MFVTIYNWILISYRALRWPQEARGRRRGLANEMQKPGHSGQARMLQEKIYVQVQDGVFSFVICA